MLHVLWKLIEFLFFSWVILMVLGVLGQLTHVGEKYAIIAVVIACVSAGAILLLHH